MRLWRITVGEATLRKVRAHFACFVPHFIRGTESLHGLSI
jgi:hypothetical protein